MNQTDKSQAQTCKNCPEPVAEDFVGITSGMYASCSASHGDSHQQIPSSQEEGFSEETIEPEPETDSPAQSGTDQVAGAGVDKSTEESKDDETKDTENNKGAIITGTTTPAEEDSPPSDDHKVCISPTTCLSKSTNNPSAVVQPPKTATFSNSPPPAPVANEPKSAARIAASLVKTALSPPMTRHLLDHKRKPSDSA